MIWAIFFALFLLLAFYTYSRICLFFFFLFAAFFCFTQISPLVH